MKGILDGTAGDRQRGVQQVEHVCVGVGGGQSCRQDELGWVGVGVGATLTALCISFRFCHDLCFL